MASKLDRYVNIHERLEHIPFSFHIKEKTHTTDKCVVRFGVNKENVQDMINIIEKQFGKKIILKVIETPCKYMIKLDATNQTRKTNLVHVITAGDIGRVVKISEQSIRFDFRAVRQAFWTTEIDSRLLDKYSIIRNVDENHITFYCNGEDITTKHPYNIPHVRDTTIDLFEDIMKKLITPT